MSNPEENKSKEQPPYFDPSLIIDTRLSEIERQQREEKAEQRKHARSQRLTNWLLTVFTGLLFFTSVVSDVLILRQIENGKLSADAAKSAADTAGMALAAANKSFEQTLAEMQAQSRAMDRAANSAEAADKLAQRRFIVENRPYVTVSGTSFSGEPQSGQTVRAFASFRNSGKTPAGKLRSIAAIAIGSNYPTVLDAAKRVWGTEAEQPGELTVGAGEAVRLDFTTTLPFTEEVATMVQQNKLKVFIFGTYHYGDIFGNGYDGGFCYFFQKGRLAAACAEGNF